MDASTAGGQKRIDRTMEKESGGVREEGRGEISAGLTPGGWQFVVGPFRHK